MIVGQNPTSPLPYISPNFFPSFQHWLVLSPLPLASFVPFSVSIRHTSLFAGEFDTTSPAFLLVPGIAGSVCLYTGRIHSAEWGWKVLSVGASTLCETHVHLKRNAGGTKRRIGTKGRRGVSGLKCGKKVRWIFNKHQKRRCKEQTEVTISKNKRI